MSGATAPWVRVWASQGITGHLRVTVINDSPRRAADVTVRIPGRPHAAVAGLQLLTAPGGAGATDATLGGRTIAANGAIAAPKPATVKGPGGLFHVAVPKGSVALLTLSPPKKPAG